GVPPSLSPTPGERCGKLSQGLRAGCGASENRGRAREAGLSRCSRRRAPKRFDVRCQRSGRACEQAPIAIEDVWRAPLVADVERCARPGGKLSRQAKYGGLSGLTD